MNVFDLSAKIALDINGYLKGMDTAKGVAISTMSIIGGAIGGFMDDSVEVGKTFDSSMSQVAATMGKTMGEMETQTGSVDTSFGHFEGTLRDFAQFMGRNTAFTASQAADALNYMALAGYDVDESMQMLPNVLSLAAAGNMDLARASDMVTDTQTAFGISAERTTQMVDEMAKAASTGNTSVEQLGDAFLVVGGLAQELNGGFIKLDDGTEVAVDGIQEMEIALTAMANAGIKGSEAGTHMRNMILKLANPTSAGTKALEKMGVAVFDNEGKMRSLSEIFGDLNTELSSMNQEDKIKTISKLFNTRDLASAEALLNAIGSDWDEIGAAILDADGAAAQMAETQLDNLAGDTKLFESALEGLKIALSDSVTPALRKMKQGGTAAISSLTETFQALPPEAQTAIGLLADFGGKAMSIAPQVMGLAGNMAQLATASALNAGNMGSFVSKLGTVAPAMGFVAAAIGTGIALWTNYKNKVAEATQEQQEFANSISNEATAYETTHEQVQKLVEGQNEYISTSERIQQLEALRVQVADEVIQAQNNLNDAQSQLTATTNELDATASKYEETLLRTGEVVGMNYEDMGILSEQQKTLQGAVDEADATYQQANTDLETINTTLEQLYEEQKLQEEAVNNTTDAYEEFAEAIPEEMVDSAASIVESVLDMEEAMTSSIQSIGNWFDEVQEREKQSAKDMKKNLKDQINAVKDWEKDLDYLADKGINQEFLTYLANMGPDAAGYVDAMKEDVLKGGQETVDEWNSLYKEKLELEMGVNEEAENVYDAIIAMGDGGAEAFSELTETFNLGGYKAGEGITLGLVSALGEKVEEVKKAAEETGEDAIDGLNEGAGVSSPSWKSKLTGVYIAEGLTEGMSGKETSVYNEGSSLAGQAISGMNSTQPYSTASNIGYWFDMGLASGISNYAYSVYNAAYNMALNAANAAKNAMQVRSPSKLSSWLGKMWDKGLEEGIVNNADAPIRAMRDMTNDVIEEGNIGVTDIGSDFSGSGMNENKEQFNVTMNIYGSEGQDVRKLAELVGNELSLLFQERQAVWA